MPYSGPVAMHDMLTQHYVLAQAKRPICSRYATLQQLHSTQ